VVTVSQVVAVVQKELLELILMEGMELVVLVLHKIVPMVEREEQIFMVISFLVDKAEFLLQAQEVQELEEQVIHLERKPLQELM
jgi:hypothetical protein